MTLTCHQHTWWVAQWNATGTTDRVHTFTPETKKATPLALGDRSKHSSHHTNHPRPHWLARRTAMHWTEDAPATDTMLPETWLTLTRNLAAYIRKHGTARAKRWMTRPTDTERTLKLRTTNLQEDANQLPGMHRPREGKDRHIASFKTATRRSRPPHRHQNNPGPSRGLVQGQRTPRPAGPNGPNRNQKRPQRHHRLIHKRSQRPKRAHSSRRRNVPPCTPNGQTAQKYSGCSGPRLEGNQSNLYGSGARYRADLPHLAKMATCKIESQALPEWGEKAVTSNLELWDDRQFPECPLQLRTSANRVPPGTIWTGDVPQAWLEEPDVPEELRLATAINLKLRLGQ